MTLLEAVIAVVILGLSAVGCLDLYRASAGAARDAGEWARVVAAAEAAMEGATLGDAAQARAGLPGGEAASARPAPRQGEALQTRVELRPWRAGVREIVVTVTSTRGVSFALHRLARDRQP